MHNVGPVGTFGELLAELGYEWEGEVKVELYVEGGWCAGDLGHTTDALADLQCKKLRYLVFLYEQLYMPHQPS